MSSSLSISLKERPSKKWNYWVKRYEILNFKKVGDFFLIVKVIHCEWFRNAGKCKQITRSEGTNYLCEWKRKQSWQQESWLKILGHRCPPPFWAARWLPFSHPVEGQNWSPGDMDGATPRRVVSGCTVKNRGTKWKFTNWIARYSAFSPQFAPRMLVDR